MELLSEQNVVRVKLGLYGGLFFFSFFTIIAIPTTTNKLDFCLLYSDLSSGEFGSDSNCNYAIAMSVIFQLLYALFRFLLLLLLVLGKFSADFMLFSDLFQLIFTVVDAVAWFLVFISACILSAGINSACNSLPDSHDCDKTLGLKDDSALSRMHTAEAGAWISFILWLLLALLGFFWLFRQGKLPCFSKPAQAGDASSGPAPGTGPPMDTPPAAEDPKY